MGKTLTRVLLVAAAIAINVVPVIGQTISGTIIGALGFTSITSAVIAEAVTGAITLGLTTAGLQAGSALLGLNGSQKPETSVLAVKTSRPPRVSAYGRSRLYGAYALYETAPNGTAVDVYAVHEGPIDGIEQWYLGDETVTVVGNTVSTGSDGRYGNSSVHLYSTDGSAPGAGFPAIETLLGPTVWDSDARGDGVAAIALTAKAVKAADFQKIFPQSGVPQPSIVARWQRCPDPTAGDPLDESGWTWTENPVRQLLHYKMVREGPRPNLPRSDAGYPAALVTLRSAWWAFRIAPTLASWIEAAAVCDSARALAVGGTEPLYRSNVAHKHTDEHKAVVAAFLATCDGWFAVRSDGAYVVNAGKYYAPNPVDDLVGPEQIVSYSWDGGAVPDADAINEIVVGYTSAEHDYNSVEGTAWRDEGDISARGKVLSAALDAQIPSHAQGSYLSKRKMARALQPNRGTITTNLAGRHARGKRYVYLNIVEAGTTFYEGPAEIISLTRAVRGGVTFQWVAADPNVDTWNPALEEGDSAIVGEGVPSLPLDAPTIDTATFDGATLHVEITAPDRPDLTWFLRGRVLGATVWGEAGTYPDTDAGAAVVLETSGVPLGENMEIQVAYQVGDGRYSPWSAEFGVDTSGVVGVGAAIETDRALALAHVP